MVLGGFKVHLGVQGGEMCFIMVAKPSVYHQVSRRCHLWGQTDLFKLRGINGLLKVVSGHFKVHQGIQGGEMCFIMVAKNSVYHQVSKKLPLMGSNTPVQIKGN